MALRGASLALVAVAALLLEACGGQRTTAQTDLVCRATLNFPSDAERAEFIGLNADIAIAQAPATTLWSHPREAVAYVFAPKSACAARSFDEVSGFRGVDASAGQRERVSISVLTADLMALNSDGRRWDQNSVRQCVLRADYDEGADLGPFMRGLISSGLRDPSVNNDGDHVFFSADETCALVERIGRLSMAQPDSGVSNLSFCEHASHRACGDPSEFTIWRSPGAN